MPSGSERQHLSVSEVGVFCSMHQAILLLHTNLSYISVWKGTLQLHPPLLLWLPHRQTAVLVQKVPSFAQSSLNCWVWCGENRLSAAHIKRICSTLAYGLQQERSAHRSEISIQTYEWWLVWEVKLTHSLHLGIYCQVFLSMQNKFVFWRNVPSPTTLFFIRKANAFLSSVTQNIYSVRLLDRLQ